MIESSSSRAVTLYVSHKAWLESVLAGNHGRVDTQNYYTDGRAGREEVLSNYEFEDDILYLRSLDPKNWKDQDHYAVLGIRNLRYRANENIIKRAYKYKILKHHPDKRKALGEEIRADDDYFTCITRAWETLGNPVKRKSYDSVDPHFNDSLPDEREARGNFFKVMSKAFIDNSRWSTQQPVPQLGDENTPREIVENFYLFWYDFESWREFSYQDEEDKESGQDRETRKWIEKKNKAVRAKKKKEEMARIRTLVDMAYSLDPRIRKFQQQDKDKKQSVKRAKQEAARERQLEEERVTREAMEEERLVRQKREIEEKAKADQLKVERETQKKALRKERKNFRELCKGDTHSPSSNFRILLTLDFS
ncbi:hypothetical protein QAD02_020763 [Eretmocerus hayati]|uniref:Uncharacterized protein n=1 Tax=Eretmocerus hayati TaxID=131215 RepID=A0ACC2PMY9_9HYME|nr:hypothetical protein QAD02_020763 [Eretmocerus hayati]